jgi:predicted transcriptional regulator
MKVIDILSEHKTINELTTDEIMERQKGFPYQLKKKGTKYFIYFAEKDKKAYIKGVKELSELNDLVKSWLESTSLTYKKWGERHQTLLAKKYIQKLKKTLGD